MDNKFSVKNFLNFIRKPDNNKLEHTIANKLKDLFKIYLITLLLLILSSLVKQLFTKLGFPIEFSQFFKDLTELKDNKTPITYIVFALLLPPIIEE